LEKLVSYVCPILSFPF